jgi:branched-chain amino acid transport system permease protein
VFTVFGPYAYAAQLSVCYMLVTLGVYVLLRAGMFAAPQIGFMAVGTYVSALLTIRLHLPVDVAIISGGAAGAVIGLLLGTFAAGISGLYLAILTIGFDLVAQLIIENLGITGGVSGLFGIPLGVQSGLLVGSVIFSMVMFWRLGTTRYGIALDAIREDPLVAAHQGINVRAYGIVLFVIAGALSGLGGAFVVHLQGYVDPSVFDFSLLTSLVAAAVLGGKTSYWGAFLGVIVIFGLPQALGGFANLQSIIDGALIILIVAFAPGGLSSLIGQLRVRLGIWAGARYRDVSGRTGAKMSDKAAVVAAAMMRDAQKTVASLGRREKDGSAGYPTLEVTDLVREFEGVAALSGVSLAVRHGEMLGLIGPNGSGKTTLLNVISGVYAPNEGDIKFEGQSLAKCFGQPHRVARLGIARTFQGIRLIPDMTIMTNVVLGSYRRHRESVVGALVRSLIGQTKLNAAWSEARARLEHLGIQEGSSRQLVGGLPYGHQRRVEIARALMLDPRLILLDEPTAGMTRGETEELFAYFRALASSGITVVIVEHNVDAVARFCDRAVVLDAGRVVAVGPPTEVLSRPDVIEAYVGSGRSSAGRAVENVASHVEVPATSSRHDE